MNKPITRFGLSRRNVIIAVVTALLVLSVGYTILQTSAGFFAFTDASKATVSGNATIVADTNATSGKAIQFNGPATPPPTTPPPTTGSRCPAFPAFPDANCTGVIPGTNLTNYTGPTTITKPGTIIENKLITTDLCIAASDVTVRNSKFVGKIVDQNEVTGAVYTAIAGQYHGACEPAATPTNILFEDVEIMGPGTTNTHDVNVSSTFAMSGNNFTCKRCNVHRWGLGFAVKQNVVIEDSYIHDTIGFKGCHPRLGSDCVAHRSCIGGNGAINATYRHNRIQCNDLNGEEGVSGGIVVYSQAGHMRAENVLIEKNYVSADNAAYCMYAGIGDVKPVNVRVIDNRFSRGVNNKCAYYGPLTYASGVTLTGNAFTDGAVVN